MNEETAERLGKLADEMDAVLNASKMPLGADIHLMALKNKLRSARDEIATIVREETGADPWEDSPFTG